MEEKAKQFLIEYFNIPEFTSETDDLGLSMEEISKAMVDFLKQERPTKDTKQP